MRDLYLINLPKSLKQLTRHAQHVAQQRIVDMLRDVFTNKWILGGIIFVIVITVGCVLWYQHELTPYRRMAAETEEMLQQSERQKKVSDTHSKTVQAADLIPVESTTQSDKRERTETILMKKDIEPSQAETHTQNIETADVPVSPFGFGPYPKVPEDYPTDVNWSSYEDDLPIYELMTRVRIKLWEEGQRTNGIVEENGLLYPIMRDTVYIKWSDNGKDIIRITGHPKDLSDDVVDQMDESGTIPADFTVIDYDNAGIDPYKFLNL